jgi:hypothetical protein
MHMSGIHFGNVVISNLRLNNEDRDRIGQQPGFRGFEKDSPKPGQTTIKCDTAYDNAMMQYIRQDRKHLKIIA